MSNKIAKSPEMLQKEGMVKDLRDQLKKKQGRLKSLKTRLKNTQSDIEEIQRKVQSQTLRKMEEVDVLRHEIADLAQQLRKVKGMSKSDKKELQMMAEELTREEMFGPQFEEYKTRKQQMESGDFNFDEFERAKMRDMFEPFQVKPEEGELRDIRKVFLKLSQKFHPDLAKGEREAEAFHALQQQINEAYQNNDIQTLLELESIYLLEELDFSVKAITVDVLQQEIDRLQRDIRFIEQQIERTSGEVKNLRQSELGQMLTAVNKLERDGDGFDSMNAHFDETIRLFTAMRDGFKDSLELGYVSPKLTELMMGGQGMFDEDDDDDDFFERGNPLDLLMRMAEGDEDAMDMFNGFYEDEMEVENPKFPIGSSVRVHKSVRSPYDPKTDMKGWEGRVDGAFYNEREQVVYDVSFDSPTIGGMPPNYIKRAIKAEGDFQDIELLEDKLVASKPRDTKEDAFAVYRKTWHQYRWSFLKNPAQEERLKNILTAFPEMTDQENWNHHIEQHLSFPFDAKTRGALYSDPGVKVQVLGLTDQDEEYGPIVKMKIRGERNSREFPLLDLKADSRLGKNYQLLEDYFVWGKEVLMLM